MKMSSPFGLGQASGDIAHALELTVQIPSLHCSSASDSIQFFAWIPSPQPVVIIAFAAASTELHDLVACVALQCFTAFVSNVQDGT